MIKSKAAIVLALATGACAAPMSQRDALFTSCVGKTGDATGCADAANRLYPDRTSRLRHIVWPPI